MQQNRRKPPSDPGKRRGKPRSSPRLQLHLSGTFWTSVLRLNASFCTLGYLIVGLFALSWIVSIAIYKRRRFDEMEFGD